MGEFPQKAINTIQNSLAYGKITEFFSGKRTTDKKIMPQKVDKEPSAAMCLPVEAAIDVHHPLSAKIAGLRECNRSLIEFVGLS